MTSEVYSSTTAPNPKSTWCLVPSQHLDKRRFVVKVAEVLLSLVSLSLEEAVSSCARCASLYLFEFVSCSCFLFALLLLLLLSTALHLRLGAAAACWPALDFLFSVLAAVLFFVSSVVFAADNNGSSLEKSAVVFGFLTMSSFVLDLVLFYRSSGFPSLSCRKAEPGGGGGAVENPAETETLNSEK